MFGFPLFCKVFLSKRLCLKVLNNVQNAFYKRWLLFIVESIFLCEEFLVASSFGINWLFVLYFYCILLFVEIHFLQRAFCAKSFFCFCKVFLGAQCCLYLVLFAQNYFCVKSFLCKVIFAQNTTLYTTHFPRNAFLAKCLLCKIILVHSVFAQSAYLQSDFLQVANWYNVFFVKSSFYLQYLFWRVFFSSLFFV